jgi:hypothetical protein
LTIGGNATNGVDYTTIPNQIQIPAGSATTVLHIKPIDDAQVEPDEIVTIGLADVATNSTFDNTLASVTIKDNDTVVQVVAQNPIGSESGAQPIVFRFTRTGDVRSQLTITYRINSTPQIGGSTVTLGDGSVRTITDGTSNTIALGETSSTAAATSGLDFTELPGTLTFQLGETAKQISVTPIDDAVPEPRESVTVSLARSELYTIGASGSATAFIEDNDQTLPTVSISATQPNANEEGPVPATITITRSSPSPQALTVLYSINSSSSGSIPNPATNGVDFEQLLGQVTIPAGLAAATITVKPIDDNEHEPEERLVLQLVSPTPPTYLIQAASSQVTIKIKDHHKP